jgi:formyl-CoA transferase
MPGPLDGVRVFEISQIVAGPYCGMNLADLGADVVKVEAPEGDGIRLIGAVAPGESKGFHNLNRGKRSLVLDLKRPEAQELVHRLIPQFDVFLINARPGVPQRLRVDYKTLTQFRPDLVYLESTGFGTVGPSATRSGSDIVGQAYSGLMAAEGNVDEFGAPQAMKSGAMADMATGVIAAMGICAALYRRAVSGEGEYIQTSLMTSALALQSGRVGRMPLADELLVKPMLGEMEAARAAGASYEELVRIRHDATGGISKAFRLYYGGYRVQDGAVILGSLTPENQNQMRRALGVEDDPTADPEYNALDPDANRIAEEMGERIRAIMLTKTMDEWIEAFDREGAPISKVNFPEDMADDPQVEAVGQMIEIEHELTGPERMVGPPVKMRRHPTGTDRPAPTLGRHSDEVLAEAGLSAEEIAGLRAVGAVH